MITPKAASEFAVANEAYVKSYGGKLPLPPARHVAIITCMDARIDPIASLGLKEGDAHVIRNAGGRASEAIRSVVISQRLLGTTEVVLFHHTDCGMLTFSDKDIRDKLTEAEGPAVAPYVEQIAFLPFSNVEQSIREDVEYIKSHPLVLKDAKVSGWVHEVETGRVRQVA
ncbi:unnamed protein product [Rhizoctonia solani]|uniref:Carbonic anhydrase n=1 Tax=Rhizoctonia solani TaxID=456999 RepID=A0A8H3GNY0_9AGAM|nr:unnamed protein product [Rhizoctonia solani]